MQMIALSISIYYINTRMKHYQITKRKEKLTVVVSLQVLTNLSKFMLVILQLKVVDAKSC